ncbi:O-antigen ligase family protein [Vibrio lentus]|uniref:O-antigen ligase family protein n=1 Tax=Vibrio lentus TaxID=136468 RepID=UPI000C823B5B|nr:O-antigen ligase family protein [Vibrio lentus]PMI88248.1 O-antigen ligase [Vibrio lentus]
MNIINRKQIYTALLLLPYFFAVTGMLVLDSGDKKMIPLFLISIIVSILAFKKETILKNIRTPFILLIITSCLYTIFSYYYHGSSSRELRALIGTTLFLIFFPYKLLTKQMLCWIVLIGGFVNCLNSLYLNIYIGAVRDTGYINPIPYATASGLLAIISFSLLIENSTLKTKALPLLSFLLYLPPIFFSESRGVWVAFSISALTLLISKLLTSSPTKKQLLLSFITVIFSLFISSHIFKNQINERYNFTIQEINKIKNNDYSTSFGLRLQMWKLAPESFKKSPLLGHGQHHQKILRAKLKNNIISKNLYRYSSRHYHNQFLDKMVKSGTIGLVIVISLLILPLFKLNNMHAYEKYIVIGSVSLFFISGLTDVPFSHPQPLMLYLLFLVPICSRCKRVTND